MLVEVNPLIVTDDREVMALDAKVSVDDNALGRQPDDRRDAQPRRPRTRRSRWRTSAASPT